MACRALRGDNSLAAALRNCPALLRALPQERLATLGVMSHFFSRVASFSTINKMTAANLSTCVGPAIFATEGQSVSMSDVTDTKAANIYMHALIINCEELFPGIVSPGESYVGGEVEVVTELDCIEESPPLRVEVTAWEKHDDGFVQYIVKCTRESVDALPSVSWEVTHRWSKFEKLGYDFYNEMLPVSRKTGAALPVCRHESWLGKTTSSVLGTLANYWNEDSDDFRDVRRAGLQEFLQSCMAFPESESSTVLRDFVEVFPREIVALRRELCTISRAQRQFRGELADDEIKEVQARAVRAEEQLRDLERRWASETARSEQRRQEQAASRANEGELHELRQIAQAQKEQLSEQEATINELRKSNQALDAQLNNFSDAVSECAEQHAQQLVESHQVQLQKQMAHINSLEETVRRLKMSQPTDPDMVVVPPEQSLVSADPSPAPNAEPSDRQAWRQLVAMGFNSEKARAALRHTNADLDKATELLLSGAEF